MEWTGQGTGWCSPWAAGLGPPGTATVEVRLLATARLRTASGGLFASALGAYAARTRAEPGCLGHEAYIGLGDTRAVAIVQRWRDPAAVVAHLDAPHAREFRRVAELVFERAPEFRLLDAA